MRRLVWMLSESRALLWLSIYQDSRPMQAWSLSCCCCCCLRYCIFGNRDATGTPFYINSSCPSVKAWLSCKQSSRLWELWGLTMSNRSDSSCPCLFIIPSSFPLTIVFLSFSHFFPSFSSFLFSQKWNKMFNKKPHIASFDSYESVSYMARFPLRKSGHP